MDYPEGVSLTVEPRWRSLARCQSGLLTRSQLSAAGIDRWAVRHRIQSERWQAVASDVIATTTGELTQHQRRWAAVLHGGEDALLSGLSAAEDAGLQRWSRPIHEVLIPYAAPTPSPLEGAVYRRTRRNVRAMRERGVDLPRCKIEPAVLLFASRDRSERRSSRRARGRLAAAVDLAGPARHLARSARTASTIATDANGAAGDCRRSTVTRGDRRAPNVPTPSPGSPATTGSAPRHEWAHPVHRLRVAAHRWAHSRPRGRRQLPHGERALGGRPRSASRAGGDRSDHRSMHDARAQGLTRGGRA